MKKKMLRLGFLLGVLMLNAQAAFLLDNFNRGDTALSTDSTYVGGAWIHSSTNMRSAVKSYELALDIPVTQSANFLMYNLGIKTLSAGDEDFQMTLDMRIPNSSIYAGIAFNIQDSNNFYAIRIKTGTTQYQVIKVVDGAVSALVSETSSSAFVANVSYTLSVASISPYNYTFEITQTGSTNTLNAVSSFNDSGTDFVDGYGGIYFWTGLASAAIDAYYDNFRIDNSYIRTQLNVIDFGAIGDGYHDDTQAFQDAFDAGADLYVPVGTYRLTSTLTLPAPFKVTGAGADSTVLLFENMGGYSGSSGIEITPSYTYRSGSQMSDLTLAIKGANGKYAISTPQGSSVYNTLPTYVFERLKFIGDVESSTYEGLYDYGWLKYINLGDGQGHVCRDIEIFGNYGFTQDPAVSTADSSIGFCLGGLQNQGGLLMPIIDHCLVRNVGIGVQFDYRVSNPLVTDSRFDLCYRGIYSPYSAVSGTDYGVLEAQLQALNIDAQLSGVYFAKSAFLDLNSVRVTRSSGGYNHVNTWVGIKLVDVDDIKLTNILVANGSSSYSNSHIGMWLKQCEWGTVSGYACGSNMTRGLWLDASEGPVSFLSILGATFTGPSSSSFYFTGGSFTAVSISGDKHTTGTTAYIYDASVNKSQIQFATWTTAQ